jgi:hypothetical protein
MLDIILYFSILFVLVSNLICRAYLGGAISCCAHRLLVSYAVTFINVINAEVTGELGFDFQQER